MANKSSPTIFTIPYIKNHCQITDKGCWEWQRSTDKRGYGLIKHRFLGGIWMYTHRAMWEAVNGPITDGMILLHACDNPRCCNPEHLREGTHQENTQDMLKKDRQNSKLSIEMVTNIKTHLKSGSTPSELAITFGVSQSTIRLIKQGKTWKHV